MDAQNFTFQEDESSVAGTSRQVPVEGARPGDFKALGLRKGQLGGIQAL
jgi:hypothetical protein